MVQRSSRSLIALALGLGSLSLACEPAGAIEGGESYVEVSPEDGAGSFAPGSTRIAPIAAVLEQDVPKPAPSPTGTSSVRLADTSTIATQTTTQTGGTTQPSAPTAPTPTPSPTASVSKTLRTSGGRILDTCGQPFAARGMEQLVNTMFSADGTYPGLASELIKTGSNAVRLLPQVADVKPSDIDTLLTAFEAQRVVVYISPYDRSWFKRDDVKQVLLKHEKGLILDAYQEPDFDDRERWVREAKEAIADLRSAGYSAPMTVVGNQYGRDLTALLERGQEVVDSDPLKNIILGWQAYWGKSGWYQQSHKMSLTQGIEAAAKKSFPVQVGIDLFADNGDEMDYVEVMAAAQKHGVSWLWWNFWNQWDGMGNNASNDGRASNLTPAGQIVVNSDPNSISKTAKKACFK